MVVNSVERERTGNGNRGPLRGPDVVWQMVQIAGLLPWKKSVAMAPDARGMARVIGHIREPARAHPIRRRVSCDTKRSRSFCGPRYCEKTRSGAFVPRRIKAARPRRIRRRWRSRLSGAHFSFAFAAPGAQTGSGRMNTSHAFGAVPSGQAQDRRLPAPISISQAQT